MRQPVTSILCVALVTAVVLPVVAAELESDLPAPDVYFGFEPGADGRLVDYEQLVGYLRHLADVSPRLELREVGATPLDRPMYVAFISSADNIARLEELRGINRRLALEPQLGDGERATLVRDGRVFVMETLSMHSGEVGPSQALPRFAFEMVTTRDAAVVERLGNVVLMLVPCHNPDGMGMIVDNYRKYLGTPFEGGSMPGVYHRYVGHDNNRDFVTLSQKDTQVISRLYSVEWYPQVLVEKHQMGRTGPRYFVPSSHDPIAEVIDEGLWTWSAVFGSNLSRDMTGDGLRGVASHWLFDNYWPGSTETSLWKNVISFLTEAASCKVATPVFVEPTELRVRGKGLAEYKKSVNMPDPWPGGWWRLADIVAYEHSSMRSVLKTASLYREEILRFRNDMCRSEVDKGRTEAPYYFVLPRSQHDRGELASLTDLLRRHGVVVKELAARVEVAGAVIEAGSVVVPLAQPYRAFVKEVMEDQRYPVRHYTPGGEVIRPYDITSWSLPRHRGLECLAIDSRSAELEAQLRDLPAPMAAAGSRSLPDDLWAVAYPATDNGGFHAAFMAFAEGIEVRRTLEGVDAGGVELGKGSFLLMSGRRAGARLAGIVDAAAVEPVVLTDPLTVKTMPVAPPRIALVETFFHDMDAGWTRFVFDSHAIPHTVVRPGDLEDLEIAKKFDVVVFPDVSKEALREGKLKYGDRYVANDYPPEYRQPLTEAGMQRIAAFVDGGGVVVSWGRSAEVFLGELELAGEGDDVETFELPARDIAKELGKKGLYVPGALLRARFAADHPLTWGMPAEGGVLSRGRPVFTTSIPILDTDRRVIATHPEEDVLISGYIEGEEQIANRAVMVWLRKNLGQVVLFGFQPQFRASMPATYKLLFNALLLPKVE